MRVTGRDDLLEVVPVGDVKLQMLRRIVVDEAVGLLGRLGENDAAARNIRVNITFSLVLKGAFLIMAFAGVATLWMPVVADVGASLIVIANALRLLR